MYISTAFKGALEDRDAQKLADYISSLTNQETFVIVTDNIKAGHTHVITSKDEVDTESQASMERWIRGECGKVFKSK